MVATVRKSILNIMEYDFSKLQVKTKKCDFHDVHCHCLVSMDTLNKQDCTQNYLLFPTHFPFFSLKDKTHRGTLSSYLCM